MAILKVIISGIIIVSLILTTIPLLKAWRELDRVNKNTQQKKRLPILKNNIESR